MWYPNQANFEGLLELAELLSQEADTQLFAEHLRLREEGKRKQAFRALDDFLEQVLSWPMERRIELVDQLLHLHYQNPKVHHFISTPLSIRLLHPTLADWKLAKPNDHRPWRWLGSITGFEALANLRKALSLEPEDEIARNVLLNLLLERIEHDLHHLPDYYLGEPAETLRFLQEIEELDRAAERTEYINRQRKLVNTWVEFQAAGEQDFEAWCRARDIEFAWTETYYYDADY